jgi:Kef-type K+ transport system membrane component KefB
LLFLSPIAIAENVASNAGIQDLLSRIIYLAALAFGLYILRWLWKRGAAFLPNSLGLAKADLIVFSTILGTLCGVATDYLGYTLMLGAFLFGAAVPSIPDLREGLYKPLDLVTNWLLLPIFLVKSGLQANVRSMHAEDLPWVLLVVVFGLARYFSYSFRFEYFGCCSFLFTFSFFFKKTANFYPF